MIGSSLHRPQLPPPPPLLLLLLLLNPLPSARAVPTRGRARRYDCSGETVPELLAAMDASPSGCVAVELEQDEPQVAAAGAAQVAARLAAHPRLATLSLSESQLGTEAIVALAPSLGELVASAHG
eukprot:COSAG06_NODE_180_length_20940_cov_7.005758_19_plen_125_part_00